jgi:ABC-type branched-subunit amino acid transport system substrate-binding protein
MRVRRSILAVLTMVIVVSAAACGSSGSKKGSTSPGTQANKPPSTAPGVGVTPTEIKLGISLTDFSYIKPFVDKIRENQEQVYQLFADDINAKGGVAGRQLKLVFHKFNPIPNEQTLATVCTQFTEDDKVFAVLGNLFDPNGIAQTCVAKQHKTPLMVYGLTQPIMEKAPGMIVCPCASPERTSVVLAQLLKEHHTIDGKKVGVLGETSTNASVKNTVVPGLKQLPVTLGSVAVLAIAGSDTTAAQSELDSVIERWKSEGTNAVYVTGAQVNSKQFVEKVRAQMPDVTLLSDYPDVLRYAQEETNAKKNPNPYEGMISAQGQTDQEFTDSENWKFCADIYKAKTGKDAPTRLSVIPLPDGKFDDTYGTISDACEMLWTFKYIGDRIGTNLNADNWVTTVDSYGPIIDRSGGPYASLKAGKYDIGDTFRLESFDSTIPTQGNWKPITELQNITGTP